MCMSSGGGYQPQQQQLKPFTPASVATTASDGSFQKSAIDSELQIKPKDDKKKKKTTLRVAGSSGVNSGSGGGTGLNIPTG